MKNVNDINWNMIAKPGFNRPRGKGKTIKMFLHLITSLKPQTEHYYVSQNRIWHFNKFCELLNLLGIEFKVPFIGQTTVAIEDARIRFVERLPDRESIRGHRNKPVEFIDN